MSEKLEYIDIIQKQPTEKRPITVDYVNTLPTGTSLSSVAISGYDLPNGVTDNSILSATTATLSGTTASVYLLAGTDGIRYKVTFAATLSDSTILKDDILMIVKAL